MGLPLLIKQGILDRHSGRLLKDLELIPHKNQYWLNEKVDPQILLYAKIRIMDG
ncbi:MAG: hypothetical protein KUG80_05770 [Gammaproteobacteria bacterium]|nr:hypothetical protein [Gammaproteobacteria bacterium]